MNKVTKEVLKNGVKLKILFLVWIKYQRRVEVLAPLIKADIKYIPHLFVSKLLRPIDYLVKLAVTIKHFLQQKPNFVIVQAGPLFIAIVPLLMGIPYIIDAHNGVFQGIWGSLPLSKDFIKKSQGVIVHNSEMLDLAKNIYPSTLFFNISDPIEFIPPLCKSRREKQILIICSFDTWDEPIETMINSIQELPEYNFIITADIKKLSATQRQRLLQCSNVCLTGFLPTKDYHAILCSSLAALVLTTSDATQPSGACEALSSDTQLILSKTSLTQKLFGDWAILVENSVQSIVQAVKSLSPKHLDLSIYRNQWNTLVQQEVSKLNDHIETVVLNSKQL